MTKLKDTKQPTQGGLMEQVVRRLAAMLTDRQRADILLLAQIIQAGS